MKIYALCASPRKRWNSDQLLDAFVEGVCEQAPEAEVEKVYLYDLDFKGCRSCFGCKLAKGDGSCVVRDSSHDLLIDLRTSDGFEYAAPIYFCDSPGQLRAFRTPFAAVIHTGNPRHSEAQRVDQRQVLLILENGRHTGDIVVIHKVQQVISPVQGPGV